MTVVMCDNERLEMFLLLKTSRADICIGTHYFNLEFVFRLKATKRTP